MKLCSIPGCGRTSECKGYCGMHYTRVFRYGDPNCKHRPGPKPTKQCSISGCKKGHKSKGLCLMHYTRLLVHGDPHYEPEPRILAPAKPCIKCGNQRPLEDFEKHPKCFDGHINVCKLCKEVRRRERLEENPDLRKQNCLKKRLAYHQDPEKARKYKASVYTPEKRRSQTLKSVYGLSEEEYQKLLGLQKSVCAICKQPETSLNRKNLSVDHCHKTGKIRGLLCSSCNRGIGSLKDSIAILSTAIEYLKANGVR